MARFDWGAYPGARFNPWRHPAPPRNPASTADSANSAAFLIPVPRFLVPLVPWSLGPRLSAPRAFLVKPPQSK
jgi:hypothetical protein